MDVLVPSDDGLGIRYCQTGHKSNLVTRFNERAASDESKYERDPHDNSSIGIYDELDQISGNLELPGAGVDYTRDDIVAFVCNLVTM